MKDYYVYRTHDRFYCVVRDVGKELEIVAVWSHPELAQEDADRRNAATDDD